MFSLKALTLDAIIESTSKNGQELTPELLTELADPEVSTYDITKILCLYINGIRKIAKGKDLAELCNLQLMVGELNSKYENLNQKYNEALKELIEEKRKEIDLRMERDRKDKENELLRARIESKNRILAACGYVQY